MSTWRRKAIEYFPELKKEFEDPECNPYTVFMELLGLLRPAHQENNTLLLQKIYAYAEWCTLQKAKDLWNAAGVGFYEHLGDHPITLENIPQWVKPEIYEQVK